MRTTVTLDDDIYEAALSLSEESGENFSKALSNLARQGLETSLQGKVTHARTRLSTLELPEDTSQLVLAHFSKAMEDEGL